MGNSAKDLTEAKPDNIALPSSTKPVIPHRIVGQVRLSLSESMPTTPDHFLVPGLAATRIEVQL